MKIQVCVVSFDSGVLVRNYVSQAEWDWPLLIDADRSLYHAHSMHKGGWWSIYNPLSIWKYVRLMLKGTMPGAPGSDFRQFGGDVLINPTGAVQMHHASTSPHDRPSIDSILSVAKGDID